MVLTCEERSLVPAKDAKGIHSCGWEGADDGRTAAKLRNDIQELVR